MPKPLKHLLDDVWLYRSSADPRTSVRARSFRSSEPWLGRFSSEADGFSAWTVSLSPKTYLKFLLRTFCAVFSARFFCEIRKTRRSYDEIGLVNPADKATAQATTFALTMCRLLQSLPSSPVDTLQWRFCPYPSSRLARSFSFHEACLKFH